MINNAFQFLVPLNKSGEEEVLLVKEHEPTGKYLWYNVLLNLIYYLVTNK